MFYQLLPHGFVDPVLSADGFGAQAGGGVVLLLGGEGYAFTVVRLARIHSPG